MKPLATIRIVRSPQTVAEHLVLGLVTGGLLGGGLVIRRREAGTVAFSRNSELFPTGPDRGEIELEEIVPGETILSCRLWCNGMARRRLLYAVVAGALVGALAALAAGWLRHISLPLALVVALSWQLIGRFREQSALRRQIEAFVHNTNYLKTM